MNTKIAIPPVISGLTEAEIHAYFAEASKLVGYEIGYSQVSHHFSTWESPGKETSGGYICESAKSLAEAIAAHEAKRPPTGTELAKRKREEAAKLLADADQIEGSPHL